MSANCLVTKLKGVVNNDNLLKIGEVAIQVTDAANFKINNTVIGQEIRADSAVLYYLDSSGNKVGEPFSEGVLNDGNLHPYGVGVESGFAGKVFLKMDYAGLDVTLNGGSADFSKLVTAQAFRSQDTEGGMQITGFPEARHEIYITKCPANVLSDLRLFARTRDLGAWLVTFSPNPGSVLLDVAEFIANKPNVENLQMYRTYLDNMESMADFGKLPNLTTITNIGSYSWTVEDFVANKRAVGVSSGSVNIMYGGDSSAGGVCSFNGQKLDSSVQLVTWTPTTITYNGTTINA